MLNVYQAAYLNKLLAEIGIRLEPLEVVEKRMNAPEKKVGKKRPKQIHYEYLNEEFDED